MHVQYINISPRATMDITLVLSSERPSTVVSKMDILSVLNPPDQFDQHVDAMEIDSLPSTASTAKSSPPNSPSISASEFPSPQSTHIHPHSLPSMDESANQLGDGRTRYETSLPPLKSLFQDISLPSIDQAKFCTQMARLRVQSQPWPNRQASRALQSRRTERLVRSFQDYEPTKLFVDQRTPIRHLRGRCRSQHSVISPLSPRCYPQRIASRGPHPPSAWSVPIDRIPGDKYKYRQPVIVADDQETFYDSSTPPKKSAHNNKAYTKEMIHWIRYQKVDRNLDFKRMLPLFFEQFPERYDPTATTQILTSRYYRDNARPQLDKNQKWSFHTEGKEKGKLIMIPAKVRDRATAEGKELDFPFTLVDRWPERVLEYEWKSAITKEDKERARQILRGNDPTDPQGSKWTLSLTRLLDTD